MVDFALIHHKIAVQEITAVKPVKHQMVVMYVVFLKGSAYLLVYGFVQKSQQ